MMKSARCLAVLVAGVWLAVSCVAPVGPIVVVTHTPTPLPPTPTPVPPTPTPTRETTGVDLTEFFPPGEGRDMVLQNCGNCHVVGAIVVVQFTEAQWQSNQNAHRKRFTALSEEKFELIYNYLKTNFYPGRPIPEVPKEFLMGWPLGVGY